jgi:isoleucyl-tRNA synthetase
LPIWSCEECGSTDAIGSFDELFERAIEGTGDAIKRPNGEIDPHRPFVDDVIIGCMECSGRMNRTPEVADAWFDSGAMPYAQHHYPFENKDIFTEEFPADFICEAVDQTRGWFYTLHALATLLHRTGDTHAERSFENVICLGHILDGEGLKMSKSVGNVINPWSVLDDYGADAVRWTMYTASPPGNSRRFSADLVQETSRKFLSTLWNTYSFFVTYANTGSFNPTNYNSLNSQVPIDRWIRSELEITVQKVTSALEAYEPAQAAHPIASFVDQLSNWYVRRNRRRFWKSGDDEDSRAALATLYHCLTTVSRLLAPFTPFIAETIYQNLERTHSGSDIDSIHLNYWPVLSEDLIDEDLSRQVTLVQKMISLGRAAREQAKVKVRQPCATVVLIPRNSEEREALADWKEDIAAELNVKAVEVLDDPGDRVQFTLKPNLQTLGPRFGKEVSTIKSVIESANSVQIIESMKRSGSVTLDEYEFTATDILVTVDASDGWSAQEDGGYLALLETRLDEALVAEGLAREIVRRLQNLRRDAGFDISDRIKISWSGTELISFAMNLHLNYVADETLALEVNEEDSSEEATSWSGELDGESVSLGVELAHSD